ncbi:hypothetical protein HanLR1_Chr16g0645481 [Helianthus annuus]|nr:hypothetical protein HanLR1_Chr16g0645481 [Helianthus annuus]
MNSSLPITLSSFFNRPPAFPGDLFHVNCIPVAGRSSIQISEQHSLKSSIEEVIVEDPKDLSAGSNIVLKSPIINQAPPSTVVANLPRSCHKTFLL